ncbi:TonB-dependent siderophore receptor [Paracoccus sp. IB05]|uniref:TonB-dependent receptor plug domain-containing protein n=1 Tax=Paracoccus sp. IB05 TaxID=2779367 RepID=UPI0018E701A2|nr:TonB-dependent receptor [Paracoccus sp. IB05]MBJ2149935.1 TonB-dependent receptor [Paracoccus sp. IB05]
MFHRVSHLALITALAAAGAVATAGGRANAQAQEEEPIELGTITLTASGEPVALSRTGATVTVLTAPEIEKRGPLSLVGMLRQVPSVTLAANGGIGSLTTLRLRGLPGYYVGTRIDGIDVSDPSNTQHYFDFGGSTTAGVSRIEVLRGSQSALYGSEAVAGVIDITSWRPTEDGVSGEAALEGGTDQTWSGTLSLGFRDARSTFAISANRTITDGISSYAKGIEDDGFRTSSLSLYGAYDLTETVTLGFNGFRKSSFSEFDSGTGDADNFGTSDLTGGRAFLRAELGATWHEISVSRMKTSREVFEFGGFTWFDSDRDVIAWHSGWTATNTLSLNWGLEHKEEDFTSSSAFGSEAGSARTSSASAEILWAATPDLDLSLALRHDDHSRFGGQNSARAALAWRPDDAWILRAVAAKGYRSPSLYELHSSYGDPGFTPENSRSFELSAERLFNNGSVQVTLFDTEISDQIIFDNVPFAYRQIDGTSTSRGIEMTGQVEIASGWQLFGNYTYADVVIDEAGSERGAPRAPRHNLTIGAEGQITDRFSAAMSLTRVAGARDEYWDWGAMVLVQEALPDYTLANLTLSYELNDTTEAWLRVENLFDEEYQTARNYGQPGRQVFLGLRTKF